MTSVPAPGEVLPHRPPFLLLDEVTLLEPGRRIEGTWTPGDDVPTIDVGLGPQVPPTLVVEAIAQLGAYGAIGALPDPGAPLFARLDRARFHHPVRRGDTVALVVEVERLHRRAGQGRGTASVTHQVAVDADLAFVFVPLDSI